VRGGPSDDYLLYVMQRPDAKLFSALLRYWRSRRGMSQLDLSVAASVSSRHLSFLETGRAQPGRDMVLRLASTLDVPLRDQNEMLRAAGFEAAFGAALDDEPLSPQLSRVIDRMIAAHEPLPLTVLNRRYDVLRASHGAAKLISHFVADATALPTPLNVFTLLFDPRLARSFVLGWERVAHALVARLHRESLSHHDGELSALLDSLFAWPGVPRVWRQPDFSAPGEPALTLRLQRDALTLSFITTVTAFSAPGNVSAEELRIESYYPLDDVTSDACASMAR
jgi:transcriptional regulator with XRE-family HTH domain